MSEKENQPFQLSFNASLKVNFQGSRVTSDGGLVLVRELDERLRLSELIEHHLTDSQFPRKAVRTLRFLLGPALVANSLYRAQEKRTMREPEAQIGNSVQILRERGKPCCEQS